MASTYPACPAPTIRLGRPGRGRARQAGEELLVNGQHLPRLSRPYRGCLFCPASVLPVLVLVDAA